MQTPSETPVLATGRVSELADKADSRIDQLSDTAHKTVDRVAESALSAARQLGEQGEKLVSAQRRWTEASCSAVCEHPLATVAIAVAAGLLFSRLTGRQ